MKTGVVYLKIRLELNMDIEEDDIPDLVNTIHCDIKDENNLIASTEIVESDTSIAF